MLGYSMMLPLLPFFVINLGGGAALAGGLSALYAFIQLFSGPVLGSLSDRIGRKPILLACLFGTAISYGLFGLAGSLWVLFAAVLIDGLTGNNLTTAYAYVADITDENNRTSGMGIVSAAFGLGLMAGPALGGLLSQFGLSVPAYAAATVALMNVLYGLFFLPESLAPEKRSLKPIQFNAFRLLADLFSSPLLQKLLVSLFLLNLAFSGLQTNFPLFSHARFGWNTLQNGLFFAFVGVLAVVVQGVLVNRLQPIFGEQKLTIFGLLCMSLGMAGIAFSPQDTWLYPSVAVAALGSGLSIPSISGLLSLRANAQQQGQLMGGQQALLSLTNIIGPAAAGLLFQFVAIPAPYWLGAGLVLLAFLVAYFEFKKVN